MTKPAVASATAVLLTGAAVLLVYDLGRVSIHMMLHIASMNIVAPWLAALIVAHRKIGDTRTRWLWIATLLQIILLWTSHAPAVHGVIDGSPALGLTLHAVLFLAALLFWLALLTISTASRWQTIPALLLTGKLACLLAALLIFAPRTLYESAGHIAHSIEHFPVLRALDDQQLAGLLMITACPVSYLVAAVIITVQLIGRPASSATPVPHGRLPVGG
jgi:putative membrane protein